MPDYSIENELISEGYSLICGVDEAGRGPLAGPVFAAAAILPKGLESIGLDDSKKLSPKKRENLFEIITKNAVSYAIGTATEKEIDEINILNATMLAMRRAVDSLSIKPDFLIVDGNKTPGAISHEKAVIKGDGRSLSIAAASILAKVSRDRYMAELSKKYPMYQFEKHKGYPTKLHYEMIEKYGVSDVHRKTFLKKI